MYSAEYDLAAVRHEVVRHEVVRHEVVRHEVMRHEVMDMVDDTRCPQVSQR